MNFRDLNRQYNVLKSEIDAEVAKVLESSMYINGVQVKEIEKELADYVGAKHCISCANGTDALSLAMMAWNIGVGDAVFVPDFTFFSSGEIVSFAGATPIFVDVDMDTYNISVDSLEYMINDVLSKSELKPKAIVAVDLFGLPADYESIKKIAAKYDLLLLEDGAQGFGGSINSQMACSFGDISTTSFFPSKPLGCYGDGGAVFTDNDEWAALMNSIKVHGKGSHKYDNVRIGMNSRLDTIQAAVLKVKLEAFRKNELEKINDIATKYTELLTDYVVTPIIPEGYISSWAQYTIRYDSIEKRDSAIELLKDNSIPTSIFYPKPMRKQEAFTGLYSYDDSKFANTDFLVKTVLSIPMHPYLTNEEIETVAKHVIQSA